MSFYTGKRRFVDPLNKKIGRRTGKDVRAGKQIRVDKDGFENFDDYFSESDAEVTREHIRAQAINEESEGTGSQCSEEEYKENQSSHSNGVSHSMPGAALSNTTCNTFMSSQTLSQGDAANRTKFGWLWNRNIGRRTGKNLTANKKIRVDVNGFENFDDYLSDSETDMSSISSRLSVSIVKPEPRWNTVKNNLSEQGTSSVNAQDSQRSGTDFETRSHNSQDTNRTGMTVEIDSNESSQENYKEEAQEAPNSKLINNSDLSDQENADTSDEEEETSSQDKVKNSTSSHSSKSQSDHQGETEDSELSEEESSDEIQDEKVVQNKNSTVRMSQSQTVQSSYVDTPLSSKRSRSHSSIGHDQETNSKTSQRSGQEISHDRSNVTRNSSQTLQSSYVDGTLSSKRSRSQSSVGNDQQIKTNQRSGQEISHDKSNVTRNSETDTNKLRSGKPKMSVGVNRSTQEDQTRRSEISRCSNSGVKNLSIKSETVIDIATEGEKETDDDSEVEDVDEQDEEIENAEEEEVDDENSHENVTEELHEEIVDSKSDNIDGTRINKSRTKCSQASMQNEKTTSESFSEAEKTRNKSKQQGTENEDISLPQNDSNYEDDDDELRPSQTNIDVAGNKSGSITKLDIPASVVSFNRTRKRLSYSAGEVSEESIQRTKSRIEQANAELFDTKSTIESDSKNVKGQFKPLSSKDNAETSNSSKNEKVKETKATTEESSDFLCLTSRSTLPQNSQAAEHYDSDDDIMILDYDKQKSKSQNENKKPVKNSKKTKKSDTESQSDNDKQIEVKNNKKRPKSDKKAQKPKANNKRRRKTTHDLNSSDVIVKKLKPKKKMLIDEENVKNSALLSNVDIDTIDNDENVNDIHDNNGDKTGDCDTNVKEKRGVSEVGNTTDLGQNTSLKKIGKTKQRKSAKKFNHSREDIDSDPKEVTSLETPVETNSDEKNERENVHIKQKNRKTSKKKNLVKNNAENVLSDERNVLSDEPPEDTGLGDNNTDNSNHESSEMNEHSHALKNKSKKFSKNKEEKSFKNNSSLERNDKTLKRKSSSEDDLGTEFKPKKAKKSKSDKKRNTGTKSSKEKNGSASSSDNENSSNLQLDNSGKRTPKADSKMSVPTHFGSGVSFRVSRRSELLEDVGSGYIGEVTVQMEPTGGLTPCITRPGAARKSKGRRVTICPEENIEHNVSRGGTSSDENRNSPHHTNRFRHSIGMSDTTPLPDPDSTPVHFCETTHSATPKPDPTEKSVIEDRLIKPSPPEQGLRRSQRTRLKPIAWYKNEQVVFDYRRRSGPAIIGVKPSLEVKWNKMEEEKRKKRKLKDEIRKASHHVKDKPYRKLSIHTELPPDMDIDENSDSEITVYNQNLQEEDGIECIGKREAFNPVGPGHKTPKKEDPYLITKQLNHPCMSSGKLCIKPNAQKPEQLVTADYVVFFIEYGKVLVKIHKTTVLLETGDTFMVPTGNTYSISNLRSDTAKLFYTIHKQIDDPDKPSESLHEGL